MIRIVSLLFPIFLTASSSAAEPVRVMSFNIRYGTAKDGGDHWDKRKEFLAATIAAFDPDLLGTQETLAFQRDFLARAMSTHEAFGVGRDDGKDGGEIAALLFRKVRFEKVAGGHFWLSPTPDAVGSKGWDAALPRIATWVKLRDRTDPAGKPVFFLNTHFDHVGKKARAESAKLIRQKLAELGTGCRLVVTGDFNAGEASDPYRALFAKDGDAASPVVDSFREIHPQRGPAEGTFNGFKPTATKGERIDWIAASRDWEIRTATIDRTVKDGRVPSDHFPVTATLRARRPGEPRTLRVLTYNIHHGEGTDGKVDLPRIAKVIRGTDPDVVALQEVDQKTKRTGGIDQTAELARLTGMHGRFGKAIDYQGGEYGQAILSRTPIDAGKVDLLPGEPEREQRIAFGTLVTIDGTEFTFATTHLHHANDEFRQRQATKLNDLFAERIHPMIIAGDLNANPDSKPLEILTPKWLVATGDNLFTFPAEKPTKQIDYILARPKSIFAIRSVSVVDEPVASDHRPLLAVIEITAP
jgi:endonuclease/exonuclease/phosphatase family metal-dependent hydrolase